MVVELATQPGASVARVARDHGVNANQVFTWRRQHAAGQLGSGAPVAASEFLSVVVAPAPAAPAPDQAGTIMLEVGRVCLRIEGTPDPATLALMLEQVLR